ncbi:hypothetical protein A2973_02705 [Candidatus Gottesmanbacteria bacterium RIFCSPLOWO2_01_FULL_49_10]|uniref:Uncharacterized protein n=1 Tax=Candidatus Gottesmanbacteria bacterium RIFCSPLOWO2_01_FULL_49_10 TaxID=1798396 RepID=A0A1F6B1K9_9BACT|nr:MAG: hypothetical protein UY10_C0004G0031 [Microgenomates group bacterium GW2011_GWA2_47_8]OGG30809.1 MAG: hypothetical protein A2973_02705 [Candidatus Gottesmanbacteria bacterium RIFCSPLOWO2_01_FULL_49_10]
MPNQLAQIINPVLPDTIGKGGIEKGGTATGLIIGNLIGGMIIFAFILAIFYFITGAFHWITSGGDKAKLETARDKIIQSMVGLIILASVWAVTTLLGQFLGIRFPEMQIPTIPKG